MIRYTITKQKAKKLIRMIASHDKVVISDGINDLMIFEVKPSRKGELHGRAKGSKPLCSERVKISSTLPFKRQVSEIREITI